MLVSPDSSGVVGVILLIEVPEGRILFEEASDLSVSSVPYAHCYLQLMWREEGGGGGGRGGGKDGEKHNTHV